MPSTTLNKFSNYIQQFLRNFHFILMYSFNVERYILHSSFLFGHRSLQFFSRPPQSTIFLFHQSFSFLLITLYFWTTFFFLLCYMLSKYDIFITFNPVSFFLLTKYLCLWRFLLFLGDFSEFLFFLIDYFFNVFAQFAKYTSVWH